MNIPRREDLTPRGLRVLQSWWWRTTWVGAAAFICAVYSAAEHARGGRHLTVQGFHNVTAPSQSIRPIVAPAVVT